MWDEFLVQKTAATVLVVVAHVLHIVNDKSFQNALKCTILKAKVQKFSGDGSQPPPQTLLPMGRGYPLPKPHPIVACGNSVWTPLAVKTWRRPSIMT